MVLAAEGSAEAFIAKAYTDRFGEFRLELPEPGVGAALTLRAVQGETASHSIRLADYGDRPLQRVALKLRGTATIRARVVDSAGGPVPHAEVLLLDFDPAPKWTSGHEHARFSILLADEHGRITATAPPGLVEFRVRRPQGPTGDRVRATVEEGEQLELGDLVVPSETAEIRLLVLDDASEQPIEGVAVRLEWAVAPPRLISGGGVDWSAQYVTDPEGRTALRLAVRDKPVCLAISAEGYVLAKGTLHASAPGAREYEVRLIRRPSFAAHVRTESGRPLDPDLPLDLIVEAEDAGGEALRLPEFVLGDGPAVDDPSYDDVHPVSYLGGDRLKVRPEGPPGEFRVQVNRPGRYRVRLRIPPGLALSESVVVAPQGGESPVVFHLPPGRVVRIQPQAEEPGSGFRRPEWHETGRIYAFPGTADRPRDVGWPADAEERAAAARSGARLFSPTVAPRETALWLPAEYTHLLVRPFLPPSGRRTPHPEPERPSPFAEGGPSPAWTRRFAVPPSDCVLRMEIPPVALPDEAVALCVQLMAGGAAWPQADVPILVVSQDRSTPKLSSFRILTDAFGRAECRVPPGPYEVLVAAFVVPAERVEVDVLPDGRAFEVELPIRY